MLETIGFAAIEAPAALGEWVLWFERAGTQVHLIKVETPAVPELGHAAFVAPDFETNVATLRERGFEVEEARELWGEQRAFVSTPGGHRIELMAAPPP